MRLDKPLLLALAIILVSVSVQTVILAQNQESTVATVTATKDELPFRIVVSAGKLDRKNTIVRGPIWFEGIKPMYVFLKDEETGTKFVGQITKQSSIDLYKSSLEPAASQGDKPTPIPFEFSFLLAELSVGKTTTVSATEGQLSWRSRLQWHDDKLTQAELQYCGKPVLKYMYEEVDNGSPKRRQSTYKVYHHVYSPDGDRRLTKGPGGLFPHHRGIFFGFNKITYGENQKADIWHCKNGESQVCLRTHNDHGPVCARNQSSIFWNGQTGEPFALENREITAFRVDGATVLDFKSLLRSVGGPIQLAGDPQHAGVQFRATQEVPENTKKMTYYIRPDGKAEPGQFRNWSNKKDESEINKAHINLPWLAMSIALPKSGETKEQESTPFKRYTICYLDSATNPKPARFSERDYGRFGSYFETTVDDNKPLLLNYRYWILDGEAEVDQIQALSDQYSNPVTFEIVK